MKSWVITIAFFIEFVGIAYGQPFEFPVTEKSKVALDNVIEQISNITEPNATVIINLSSLTGSFELETVRFPNNNWRKDITRIIIKGPEDKSLIFQKTNNVNSGAGIVFVIGEKDSNTVNKTTYELQNLVFDEIASYDYDGGSRFGDSAVGGVVVVFSGCAEFNNCDFLNIACKSNYGWAYGGSIFATNSTVNFVDCQFKENFARGMNGKEDLNYRVAGSGLGGAVYAYTCQLKFQDCLFDNNWATGGYAYDDMTGYCYGFSGGDGWGGAVCLEKSKSEFLGCDFVSNISQARDGEVNGSFGSSKSGNGGNAYGGAVSSTDHSTTIFRSTNFKENRALAGNAGASLGAYGENGQGLGGGLYVDDTSQVFVSTDCSFENNDSSNSQTTGFQYQIVNNTKDVSGIVLPVGEETFIKQWMMF